MAKFNRGDPSGSHEYGNYYNPNTSGGFYDGRKSYLLPTGTYSLAIVIAAFCCVVYFFL